MGRTVDQEVHAAFVEFRAKEDDKVRDSCISRNISAKPLPRHRTDMTTLVSLKTVSLCPVHLLPTDPRKKHIAPEAALA